MENIMKKMIRPRLINYAVHKGTCSVSPPYQVRQNRQQMYSMTASGRDTIVTLNQPWIRHKIQDNNYC